MVILMGPGMLGLAHLQPNQLHGALDPIHVLEPTVTFGVQDTQPDEKHHDDEADQACQEGKGVLEKHCSYAGVDFAGHSVVRLAAWVMASVKLTQPFARDVGVYLCGTDVRVPKQQLHSPQIRAMVDEMGREGVSQGMG